MDCLKNLERCQAECCKLILIDLSMVEIKNDIDKTLVIRIDLTPDQQRYYRFHKCNYERGRLRIPNAEYKEVKDTIFLFRNCNQLTADNKCRLHDLGLKPKCCWDLDERTKTNRGYFVTPNCTLNDK